jgi:hypothetical protein
LTQLYDKFRVLFKNTIDPSVHFNVERNGLKRKLNRITY